jgi:hypothetical protein
MQIRELQKCGFPPSVSPCCKRHAYGQVSPRLSLVGSSLYSNETELVSMSPAIIDTRTEIDTIHENGTIVVHRQQGDTIAPKGEPSFRYRVYLRTPLWMRIMDSGSGQIHTDCRMQQPHPHICTGYQLSCQNNASAAAGAILDLHHIMMMTY